jgi:hypothetical protein
VVALVLIFAQCVAAFGFPIVQSRLTVKACGCVMPCGSDPANCCCSKPTREGEAPAEPLTRAVWEAGSAGASPSRLLAGAKPEPKKARCPRCVEKDELPAPPEHKVKWITSVEAKKCRGETAASGFLAEIPCMPPAAGESGRDFTVLLDQLCSVDSNLASHISATQDPPPRRS